MKITIIVPDRIVSIDSKPLQIPGMDWTPFYGDPTTPYDDVHAVHFDTATGQGHVEYAEVTTQPATRPNMKPGNWLIGPLDFESRYGFVIEAYRAQEAQLEAERQLAAERAEARLADLKAEHATNPNPELAAQVAVLQEQVRLLIGSALDAADRTQTE